MRILPWFRIASRVMAGFVVVGIMTWAGAVFAQSEVPAQDAVLARMYTPVLYFHPAEVFRPQPVDVMVDSARLRQRHRYWVSDINVLSHVSIADLVGYKDASYALDAWYGDEGASDYTNYTAHRVYYQAVLSPEAAGPPIVAYAHVVRDEDAGHITIQYWLFYYYNDWFNKHEGDWEAVQVMLSAAGEPEWDADERAAVLIVPPPVGELSVMWNSYLGRWTMTYLDESRASIVIREASQLWGPWSLALPLASGAAYPGLYGAYMHPWLVENEGEVIYFAMSQWGPYSVFLMRAHLANR